MTFNLIRIHVYDLVGHITSIFENVKKNVRDVFLIKLKVRCYSKITYEKRMYRNLNDGVNEMVLLDIKEVAL